MKKLCLGIAFLAVVACGGGGGGSSEDPSTPPVTPPTTPTLTVGSTVVSAGQSATIHAAVGDTLTLAASEAVPTLHYDRGTGTKCSLSFPNGLQSGASTYTVKIGADTDQCVFAFTFGDAGTATLTVLVP
jgi:hypothetical protein